MGNSECCCAQDPDPKGAGATTYPMVPPEQDRQGAGFSSFSSGTTPERPKNEVLHQLPVLAEEQQFATVVPPPAVSSAIEQEEEQQRQPLQEEKSKDSYVMDGLKVITITILKKSHVDRLGLDLQHQDFGDQGGSAHDLKKSYLLVRNVESGKAADGTGLQVGDKIVKVNDVEGSTDRMIGMCGESLSLVFHVVRPSSQVQPS
mmetsp:Transcript_68875/g.165328  ORF Transcript_68875/g.165328 Transcript_68875/m.165328 type:complete len:203 (+) Transcript_68875:74-682(+)|eukprot:CAMPEP_0178412696 /NCGR_PEP_ID=MMETSP0689_2-20121128/22150_1 /TAXON_ID=160604 /ORGANISM="Amphidinium massartii, Strain CS-259" /LENGTH=202 /DNA_ID=CAMNT_0020033955 /DNA_START=6 /DNA_END=614 /DNA_ORIENTATION=+